MVQTNFGPGCCICILLHWFSNWVVVMKTNKEYYDLLYQYEEKFKRKGRKTVAFIIIPILFLMLFSIPVLAQSGPEDFMKLFGQGQLPPQGGMNPIYLYLPVILIIVFVVAIIIVKKGLFYKYPVFTKINKLRKHGKRVVSFTKARRLTKKDSLEQQYQLKDGRKISAQKFENIDVDDKGRDFLELDEYEDGRLTPHIDKYKEKGNPGSGKEDIELNYDDVNYLTYKIQKNIEKFKASSFWSKWAIPIMVVLVMFVSAFMIYVVVQYGVIPIINSAKSIARDNQIYMAQQSNMTNKWMTFMEQWMTRFDRPYPVSNGTG